MNWLIPGFKSESGNNLNIKEISDDEMTSLLIIEFDPPEEEAYALTVKHLQGKHNQRRHGWRFGSTIAAQRSLRSSPKSEREEYRRRAGMVTPISKSELHEVIKSARLPITRIYAGEDVGHEKGSALIRTPYDENLVREIKKLPVTDRAWKEN